jgi:hypothetical protein
VILAGCIYVTEGTARRSTGTHYTPPSLTEPIVQHTLEPLVFEGPAEGWQRQEWKLKTPRSILDLKVCDMAKGSGAFLVQACRLSCGPTNRGVGERGENAFRRPIDHSRW